MQLNKRQNVDPMRIAWILRADLRRGSPPSGPVSDWFRMWWLIHGTREYPEWADNAALCEARLFRPELDRPNYGGFGMNPALQFLLDTREDLSNSFDVNTEAGLNRAIAWFFVHGVREHQLAAAIDQETLNDLDATPPFLADHELTTDEAPELTWLMFFVWNTSSELQVKFDLSQRERRHAYLAWFLFNGVSQLKLAPLIALRWHKWLHQPVLRIDTQPSLPRAAYMLWQQHQQLQSAFDLQTKQGIAALSLWAKEVWQDQPQLSWIGQFANPLKKPIQPWHLRPFGVNLIGFAFGELGIGEDVRMAVEACEMAGIPFTVVNIQPGGSLRQADLALAEHVEKTMAYADVAPYAFNLFCLTAFDTSRVYLERGRDMFDGRYNIGWWPWELPVWPKDWNFVFDLVDEVWAATNYTFRTYSKAVSASNSNARVTLMSMPASVARIKPMTREALNLPTEKFLFLYVFDFNSYLARKNPFAAVKAFRKAFNTTDNTVGLVLKTMNSDPRNPQWLNFRRECAKDSRITVIDKTMERGEVLGLIKSCDAYISLHRAEGLGRTIAEAMLFGKPVISTDFSGSVDFVNSDSGFPVRWKRKPVKHGEYAFIRPIDYAWWADVSIADAAHALRQARLKNQSDTITIFAKDFFSPARVGALMMQRLTFIYKNLTL